MAQATSDVWKSLFRGGNAVREYAFDIDGVWYGPESEVSHAVDGSLFEDFGIGNAMSATLTLSLYADQVPRGAVIKRYIRLTDGSRTSEWLPMGVFFTNRRTNDDGFWSVEAYDAILKADITWTPRKGFTFPCTMEEAAQDIARSMGVELDERNVFQPYTIPAYPEGEYTRRDALRDIAAAHGGNWYATGAGKLRLVPLISFPAETDYLVTEHGEAVLFGGVRILLSSKASPPSLGLEGADKHYVGLDVTGFQDNGKRPAITSVTLQKDGDNTVTAGEYTGLDLYAVCPYATQEMALNILLQVRGYEYRAFQADSANLDPAAELGDGVDVGGIYAVLSAIDDDGDGYPGISAPGEEELEDEFPYRSASTRELSNDVDSVRSFVTKSLGAMTVELNSIKTDIQQLTALVQAISNTVTQLESRVSALEGGT